MTPQGQQNSFGDKFTAARRLMVENQIRARGVKDERVLAAMLKVPRHLFVPPEEEKYAYEDHPLPIGHGQTISQPYIVAYMTELLKLESHHKVLEIGTGSGYQTAILAELCENVYSLEVVPQLHERAKIILERLGYSNRVHLFLADGYNGLPEHAPFDRIILTAAPPTVPRQLVQQLKVGGRMVLPVGIGIQRLVLIEKDSDRIVERTVDYVRFVPMVRSTNSQND